MPLLNSADRKEIIGRRREQVGQLRAKGMTIREIEKMLPLLVPPIVDEKGEPWSRSTIHKDLVALLKEWNASAQAYIGEHIARQLAELTEAKREARQQKDLQAWARFMALEMKLLGTAAPEKSEDWSGRDWQEYVQQVARETGRDIEQVKRDVIDEAQRLLAANTARRAAVHPAGGDEAGQPGGAAPGAA